MWVVGDSHNCLVKEQSFKQKELGKRKEIMNPVYDSIIYSKKIYGTWDAHQGVWNVACGLTDSFLECKWSAGPWSTKDTR